MCDFALTDLKSKTGRSDPSFFGTQKMGELYFDLDGDTTPSLIQLFKCSIRTDLCDSGILNCFTKVGSLSLSLIECCMIFVRPRSILSRENIS